MMQDFLILNRVQTYLTKSKLGILNNIHESNTALVGCGEKVRSVAAQLPPAHIFPRNLRQLKGPCDKVSSGPE